LHTFLCEDVHRMHQRGATRAVDPVARPHVSEAARGNRWGNPWGKGAGKDTLEAGPECTDLHRSVDLDPLRAHI
jgi:hypothetical protein